MSKVKCRYCHKEIDKDTAYSPKARMYYCNKEEYELSKVKNTKTKDEYAKPLLSYIGKIYGSKMNYPFIQTQLKSLRTNYGYKSQGMLLTLQYVTEIKKQHIDVQYGISHVIIKHYNQARQYWIQSQKIKKAIDAFEFDNTTSVIKTKVTNDKIKHKLKVDEF
jgi:hypothetical protein